MRTLLLDLVDLCAQLPALLLELFVLFVQLVDFNLRPHNKSVTGDRAQNEARRSSMLARHLDLLYSLLQCAQPIWPLPLAFLPWHVTCTVRRASLVSRGSRGEGWEGRGHVHILFLESSELVHEIVQRSINVVKLRWALHRLPGGERKLMEASGLGHSHVQLRAERVPWFQNRECVLSSPSCS